MYKLARPLLDTGLKNKLDEIAQIETKEHRLLVDQYTQLPRQTIEIKGWTNAVCDFRESLSELVQEQVSQLINS